MKRLVTACTSIAFAVCVGCGGSSGPKVPNMNGTWTMVLTGGAAGPGEASPPSSMVTMTLNQSGNMLSGSVLGINTPQSSCLYGIANAQTRFTVSGNVTNPVEAGSNLQLTVNFVTGTNSGSVQAKAAASESAAHGLFSVSPATGCTGGTLAMTKTQN